MEREKQLYRTKSELPKIEVGFYFLLQLLLYTGEKSY